jgi:hypothetical protein
MKTSVSYRPGFGQNQVTAKTDFLFTEAQNATFSQLQLAMAATSWAADSFLSRRAKSGRMGPVAVVSVEVQFSQAFHPTCWFGRRSQIGAR